MFLNELLLLIILACTFSLIVVSCIKETPDKANKNFVYVVAWTNVFTIFVSLLLIHNSFKLGNIFSLPFWTIDDISKYFSLTPLSSIFVFITCFVTIVSAIIGISEIKKKKIFSQLVLITQILCIILFSTNDIVVFYACFEAILIPMFLLIGINTKHYFVGMKFVTLLVIGSIFLLAGIVYLVSVAGETNITALANSHFTNIQKIVSFWLLFIGLAFKAAVFPFHIWLPDAHSMAPTSASVILSGVFLKVGVYGILAILFKIFNDIFPAFLVPITILNAIGIIVCCRAACVQNDFKRIIAYISIIHMNIICIGIMRSSVPSLTGAAFAMAAHSLTSVGLFTIAYVIKKDFGGAISNLTGIFNMHPIFGIVSLPIFLSGISFPMTVDFVGEFAILSSIITESLSLAIVLGLSVIFSMFFIFKIYKDIFFGPFETTDTGIRKVKKISKNEIFLIGGISVLIMYLGCFPNCVFKGLENAVRYCL